jgi:hypothetical protein
MSQVPKHRPTPASTIALRIIHYKGGKGGNRKRGNKKSIVMMLQCF